MTLKLSDADCMRIAYKAGEAGLTVGKLLEEFIGDLVYGTYTNGSDERMYANKWFDRCWFGMFPEDTLLRRILEYGSGADEVERFLTVYDEMEYYKAHPEEYADELAEAGEDGENGLWFVEEYHEYVDDFVDKIKEKANMADEIQRCRNWLTDYQRLLSKAPEENICTPENSK